MRIYEAVLIFRPEDEFIASGKDFIKKLFETSGCKIIKEEEMGNRELAYEINKNKRGVYQLYEIESKPETVQSLGKSLKLRNEIIKFSFFRKEE